MPAKLKVTHRMLGAIADVGTAVGSRPKLKTTRTRAVNTAADRIAVRVRNSSSRSFRAMAHACRSRSATGHRPAVGCGDLRWPARAARRDLHEAAAVLEGDLGRELHALLDVVGGEHDGAASTGQLGEQPAELRRRREVEAGERLVEQQYPRLVDQGARDGGALHPPARQGGPWLFRPVAEDEPAHQIVGAGAAVPGRYGVQRPPEEPALAYPPVGV